MPCHCDFGEVKSGPAEQAERRQRDGQQPRQQQRDGAHQREHDPVLAEHANALVEHIAERQDATVPRLEGPQGKTSYGHNVSHSDRSIQRVLASMTLEQKVGQVFMLGFEGTTLNAANRALIQDWHLGGVTLFGRNVENGPQLARLNDELQKVAEPVPLFISADQEGGLVVRVTSGATIFPGQHGGRRHG